MEELQGVCHPQWTGSFLLGCSRFLGLASQHQDMHWHRMQAQLGRLRDRYGHEVCRNLSNPTTTPIDFDTNILSTANFAFICSLSPSANSASSRKAATPRRQEAPTFGNSISLPTFPHSPRHHTPHMRSAEWSPDILLIQVLSHFDSTPAGRYLRHLINAALASHCANKDR